MDKQYSMYILASRSRMLYTGVTGELRKRVIEHKLGLVGGFTKKYRITRLVYYENHPDVRGAIAREKQIKRWRREKKVKLIEAQNPVWDDLAAGWLEDKQVPRLRPAGSARDDKQRQKAGPSTSLGMTG